MNRETLSKILQVRLTDRQYERLVTFAKEQGRPVSNAARRLIDRGTRTTEPKQTEVK